MVRDNPFPKRGGGTINEAPALRDFGHKTVGGAWRHIIYGRLEVADGNKELAPCALWKKDFGRNTLISNTWVAPPRRVFARGVSSKIFSGNNLPHQTTTVSNILPRPLLDFLDNIEFWGHPLFLSKIWGMRAPSLHTLSIFVRTIDLS